MDLNQEIKKTRRQLELLSLQQTALVTKLENLERQRKASELENLVRQREARESVKQAVTPEPIFPSTRQTQPFKIGDRVLINKPNGSQQNHGIVTKISNSIYACDKRVTVRTPSGGKVQRAPKNLTLLEHR